ncbi:bifunctional indole-3-glycerol-phosphate synthase TrpC/phosphoribosylanthranilate isomerase TrpF [Shewanella sp. 202IG2-18]|uniref:bifunctional indole-3-glycerol-phosphate synthase TrpC/phosphoribosylanthranilate isomerase TrpF n=1 Tax=Parashewanella hymeniacidonis TaxID=2807618 RepID=UPI0019617F00|nr:bifunctional indole-3-glycerol-phosphate synthase TrpC/phosphoribosylanthranilate isomerase TrpF [Parashewanella hymeniacidonis]MBM7070548.1 bifunctional indole-3-glycerol-phosphate synthase TrpC/phosphoribosylanthranilate isomerase TrpF [Parashewanella hymeniacidonis]
MQDILKRIVATKDEHIAQLKERFPETGLNPKVSKRSLYQTLKQPNASFILECKKASPSKGLIREDFDLGAISSVYRKYASAVSVLTDEQFFQGSFEYLARVRSLVDQPVLCKDFFVDEYQIKLAAHQGADAILLMLSVLSDKEYQTLSAKATEYQLDILTEVSNDEELNRAIELNAQIIGINNRNLRDLTTDLATSEKLAPRIPRDRVVISESGIYTNQQVKRLAPIVNGFLVGSSLMAEADIDLACRTLIFGNTKVCGITRIEDSSAVANAGASYAGLIFTPKSPRCIGAQQAKNITEHHKLSHLGLRFVGVFADQNIEEISSLAKDLDLFAVQLHGSETEDYIDQLKQALQALGSDTVIWKAVAVSTDNNDVAPAPSNADRVLFDSKSSVNFGGTGQSFDWQRQLENKTASWLAGGLSPENAEQAMKQNFYGLDFNSGLEISPGVKDKIKIQQVFKALRNY